MILSDSLQTRAADYKNTAEHNDRTHDEFTQLTESIPFLHRHRRYIETNQLGFGDPAFHYMWYLLIRHLTGIVSQPKLLEIGVYKGQVISLWVLLSAHLGAELSVTGISPFKGHVLPKSKWQRRWKKITSMKFRKDLEAANFYEEEDYKSIVSGLFEVFDLPRDNVRLIEGLSTDESVLAAISHEKFSLIYIDGDHSFEGVRADITNYAPLLEAGAFLVMDDASYYLPGSKFWKGHEPVSRACEELPALGFRNVLNVGHNRVYQKIG